MHKNYFSYLSRMSVMVWTLSAGVAAQDPVVIPEPIRRVVPMECCSTLSYYRPDDTNVSMSENVVQVEEDEEGNLYLLSQVENAPSALTSRYGAVMRISAETNQIDYRKLTVADHSVKGFVRDEQGIYQVIGTNDILNDNGDIGPIGIYTIYPSALPYANFISLKREENSWVDFTPQGTLYLRRGNTGDYQYIIGRSSSNGNQALTIAKTVNGGEDLQSVRTVDVGGLGAFYYEDGAVIRNGNELILAGYTGGSPSAAVCYTINLISGSSVQRVIRQNARITGITVLPTGEIVLAGNVGQTESGVPKAPYAVEANKVWLLNSAFSGIEEYTWPVSLIRTFGKVIKGVSRSSRLETVYVSAKDADNRTAIVKLSVQTTDRTPGTQRVDTENSGQYAFIHHTASPGAPPILQLGYEERYLLFAQTSNSEQVLAGRLSYSLDHDCLRAEPLSAQITGSTITPTSHNLNPSSSPSFTKVNNHSVDPTEAVTFTPCSGGVYPPVDCYTQNCPVRTGGTFSIQWPAICPERVAVRVSVRNRLGHLVRENLPFSEAQTIELDLSNEESGTYFVEVRCDDNEGRILFTSSVEIVTG